VVRESEAGGRNGNREICIEYWIIVRDYYFVSCENFYIAKFYFLKMSIKELRVL